MSLQLWTLLFPRNIANVSAITRCCRSWFSQAVPSIQSASISLFNQRIVEKKQLLLWGLDICTFLINHNVAKLSVSQYASTPEPTLLHSDALYTASITKYLFVVISCGNRPRRWINQPRCGMMECVFFRFLDRQDESSAADCRSWNRQGIKWPAGF